jgi:hypothetical protein
MFVPGELFQPSLIFAGKSTIILKSDLDVEQTHLRVTCYFKLVWGTLVGARLQAKVTQPSAYYHSA